MNDTVLTQTDSDVLMPAEETQQEKKEMKKARKNTQRTTQKQPVTMTKRLFKLVDKLFYKAQNPPKKTEEALKGLVQWKEVVHDPRFAEWKLDLIYRPRFDGRKYPVVFEIHGGGFSAGDKNFRLYHCAQIARRSGAMVVNVNHPLGPEHTCPLPMQCLVSAFNWVIANAVEYNMDTSRMCVTGDSSGAYYAALLAMLPDNLGLQQAYGKMNGRFSHAAYICGVYDVADSLSHRLPFGITTGVCQDISGRRPKQLNAWEYMPYISPIDFVTPAHPKALIIYAAKDFFCKGQAETLIDKLQSLGVECQSYGSRRFADNHAFTINNNNAVAVESREMMYRFFEDFAA